MLEHITAPAPRLVLRMLRVRRLLDRYSAELSHGGSVCEIGSGLGDTASLLRQTLNPEHLHLHELSETARAVLTDRFSELDGIDVRGPFVATEAGPSYDFIAVMEVLEHVEHDTDMLSAIVDRLSPGGWLLGSVPAFMRKWQDSDLLVGHYRRYENYELRTKLCSAGMDVAELQTYGFPLLNVLDPLRRLHYRKELSHHRTDRTTATTRSGVSRTMVRRFDKRLVLATCTAGEAVAPRARVSELDDGFVFLCRKPA